jgi:cation diffusion facilitator CzcD-associated flavoprotein CzcO
MSLVTKLFLSFLWISGSIQKDTHGLEPPVTRERRRSIAIIGAGTAGLSLLKTILDFPEDVKDNLDIVVFERRKDVGGVWWVEDRLAFGIKISKLSLHRLPDNRDLRPPQLPETPLYDLIQTNTPHPSSE